MLASIYSRILAISWPLILSNLSVPLLGIADTAMLGHLDAPLYLAAVSLGASLVTLILASTNFLRMSTIGLSAQAFGQQNDAIAAAVFRQSALLALALGFGIVVLSPWLSAFGLDLMVDAGTSPALHTTALGYVEIRFIGAPATLLNFVIVGWAVGRQNSRLALLSLTSTAVFNILFDAVFIIALDMNSQGAAWASVLAEITSLILCSYYLFSRYPWLKIAFTAQTRGLVTMPQLMRMNGDFFIRSLCLLWVFAFFNRTSATFGDAVLAANAILLQLILLQSYALDGFANAAEALVGQARGRASQAAEYRTVLKATAIASFFAAMALIVLLGFASPWLVHIFTNQPQLMDGVNHYLPAIIVLPLISVWAYWLDGVAIGFTASGAMRNSSLICALGIFLPLWLSLADAGNPALWLAFFVFTAARGVVLGGILYHNRHTLMRT